MSLVALAFLAVLAPAAPRSQSNDSIKETRALVRRYGDCVVKRQRRKASEAILANANNRQLIDQYSSLIDENCVPAHWFEDVRVQFQGDQFRYGLADALVRVEFASSPAPDMTKVPPLDHHDPGAPPGLVNQKGKRLTPKEYDEAVEAYHMAQAFSFLSRYGECVVRTDPPAAHALLVTIPDSAEEAKQFASMQTSLATCLPMNPGEQLKFGKLALRGTIAINYYRLAKAASAAREQEPAE